SGRGKHRQCERRLVDRNVDRAANTGPRALDQGSENADHRLRRAADVGDQRSGQLRWSEQAGKRLIIDIVSRALSIRTSSTEAADRRADEMRVSGANLRWVDS